MTNSIALFNARIYIDWQNKAVEALLIENGVIKAYGENSQIKALCPSNIKQLDLEGMTVWPGFCDAHLHLAQLAQQLAAINCEGLSKSSILEAVRQRAEQSVPGEWIIGFGFNQNDWTPPEYGTAKELDTVSPNNPVLIHAKSLHAAWTNTFAIRQAGVHTNTPDPDGGAFLRNTDGSPNGILLESAVLQVIKHIPQTSHSQLANDLLKTQNYLHRFGVTAVHDFDDIDTAEVLLTLNAEDKLRLRVMKSMRFNNFERLKQENWREKLNAGPYLRAGWLKLFADGALGPQSAAMLEPYENSTNKGMLLMSQEELADIARAALEIGWTLSIHAIGDLATRVSLDTIQGLNDYEPIINHPALLPHRIEHIQALNPSDLPRFAQLKVIASVQPVHATSDYLVAERLWGLRCEQAYAYQSLNESGAELFAGTDAPVELANPFHTLYAAITRQTLSGDPKPNGWYPKQRLKMKDALNAMTINPARYYGHMRQTGNLRPGSNADFIVLKQDPFELSPIEIARLLLEMTFVAGECVYSKQATH